MSSWLPTSEKGLIALFIIWANMLEDEAKATAFKWIEELRERALGKIIAFLTAAEDYESNDNTANREAKNLTKAEAIHAAQEFADTSVRKNPFMTDADRRVMGIPTPDRSRTPQPRPSTLPRVVVDVASHRQHRVRALIPDTESKAKPAGVHGVRFVWQVGGEPPTTGDTMARSQFSRKPEIVVTHVQADVGKPVWYAACYENAKGEAGPWSTVEEAYIS